MHLREEIRGRSNKYENYASFLISNYVTGNEEFALNLKRVFKARKSKEKAQRISFNCKKTSRFLNVFRYLRKDLRILQCLHAIMDDRSANKRFNKKSALLNQTK